MPHKSFYGEILIFFSVTLAGCQFANPTSSSIADQFSASGQKRVNLASAVPGNWDRVCVLAPYSSDASATQALGFK